VLGGDASARPGCPGREPEPGPGPGRGPRPAPAPASGLESGPEPGFGPESGSAAAGAFGPESAPASGPESAPASGPESAPASGPESAPASGPESGPESAPASGPESAPESGPGVIPPHESAVRRLAADAGGGAYRALRSLAEAQAVDDGVVVLEGDLGGQVYAVFPARVVRCSETRLLALAGELDRRLRPGAGSDDADVYFERHPAGGAIAGGGGGGVVLPGGWVNDELVQAGLEPFVVAVVTGREPPAVPPG
jgi:hypothetical protein